MGGKKKKSAAAPTSVTPAAAGNWIQRQKTATETKQWQINLEGKQTQRSDFI